MINLNIIEDEQLRMLAADIILFARANGVPKDPDELGIDKHTMVAGYAKRYWLKWFSDERDQYKVLELNVLIDAPNQINQEVSELLSFFGKSNTLKERWVGTTPTPVHQGPYTPAISRGPIGAAIPGRPGCYQSNLGPDIGVGSTLIMDVDGAMARFEYQEDGMFTKFWRRI